MQPALIGHVLAAVQVFGIDGSVKCNTQNIFFGIAKSLRELRIGISEIAVAVNTDNVIRL